MKTCRWMFAFAALVGLPVVCLAQQQAPPKAKAAGAAAAVARTPDGKPDLQGIWTNATLTKMERPAGFSSLTVTEEEAAKAEKAELDLEKKYDGKADNPIADALGSGGTGGYNALFVDHGTELARVDGVKRTSLIIDPPNGKMPAMTPEGRNRAMGMYRSFMNFSSASARPLAERCILGFGSTAGPPMMPVLYNNNYQIVQTPETVMILVEMVHDARIIRINGKHAAPSVRQWLGDSIGHWDGDTLVVETTNFTEKNPFYGAAENLKVTERFRRVDANTILYKVTLEDPTTFAKPWTMEYPFRAVPGPIYEYACHEGNYSLTDILGGARKAEEEAAAKKK